MTSLADHEFTAIRLRVDRPARGTPAQAQADLSALVGEVLHLQAEITALKQRPCPQCGHVIQETP